MSWLRVCGVQTEMPLQTDWGEEHGGSNPDLKACFGGNSARCWAIRVSSASHVGYSPCSFACEKPKIGDVSLLEIRTEGLVDDWSLLRWTDSAGDALQLTPPTVGAVADLPPAPFGVAYPACLEGVGRVYLWTNGFTARQPTLTLEPALATRYLEAASALVKQYARRGVPMETAQQHLQQAQALQTEQRWAECLAASVAAAEASVVSLARARLERMHGRTAFLWGVWVDAPAALPLPALAPPLNLIALRRLEPSDDWRALIQHAQGIRAAVAAFWTSDLCPRAEDALRETVAAYRGSVRYWNIAANLHRSEPSERVAQQIGALCEVARATDFGVVRLLHGAHGYYEPSSPYALLELCAETGAPYEAIHLEWQWYDGTLYDLDQLLERYGELGKPIHLSISLPPEEGYGVFSRAEPLAWLEGACLIALSKPYVIALQVPLQATERSGGALDASGQPSAYWQRLAQVAARNASLLD